ncbi:hypothetical protein FQR65_LT00338 [Abscondita terminalis]|nr:hypothetical protein FQR65_LT00338 [Abscondita terminalis]
MAAKRITQSAINWTALAERVPENQRPIYFAFKSKSDGYLRRVLSQPETPPQIDWSYYESVVPVKGMVENFRKSYEALKIPYPPDTVSGQLDALEKEIKGDIEKFKNESNQRIDEYKKQLAYLASLIPFDQMTMEDYKDAFPEEALDPVNNPTFWPHEPDDKDMTEEEPTSHH